MRRNRMQLPRPRGTRSDRRRPWLRLGLGLWLCVGRPVRAQGEEPLIPPPGLEVALFLGLRWDLCLRYHRPLSSEVVSMRVAGTKEGGGAARGDISLRRMALALWIASPSAPTSSTRCQKRRQRSAAGRAEEQHQVRPRCHPQRPDGKSAVPCMNYHLRGQQSQQVETRHL